MSRKVWTCWFVLFLFSCITQIKAAQANSDATLQPGQFLKQWLVLRPIFVTTKPGTVPDEAAQKQAFAKDWLVDKGGEEHVHPRRGSKITIAGRTLSWQPMESDFGFFSLADMNHPMDYAISYAWTEFSVVEKQQAFLAIGSDEGVKVWLNGKLVHEHWICRGVRVDDDLVPVELQSGKNTIVLKIHNSTAPSGFACRIMNPEQAESRKRFRAGIEAPGTNTLTDADIKTLLRDNIDLDKQAVGLVVGIVDEHGPRVISHGKLGNGTDRDVDGDTLFEIGSITKVFTSLLLQDMIERGEMKLDDPAQKYLPASVKLPTYQGKEITLLHLATHTSGLPRDSRGDLYEFLSHCTLKQAPGTRWDYSNLGAGLLGHLIALKAGKDYETLVVERICQPLGMDSTRITITPELKARLATGHGMAGHPLHSSATSQPQTNAQVPNLRGAGSLRSSANDLLKFVSAYAGLTPSPLSSLMQKAEALHTLESGDKRALAWEEFGTVFKHGGAMAGFKSELAFDIDKRRGVVLLSNCRANITLALWRPLLTGRPLRPPGSLLLNPARYADYEGQYQAAGGPTWNVWHGGDRLRIQYLGKEDYHRHLGFEVFPQLDSTFANEVYQVQVMFLPPSGGRPGKLMMNDWDGQGAVETTKISTEAAEIPDPTRLAADVYESYVGQYRKTFLFGLIRVGPTLSISHKIDEVGDHLIARVLGLKGQEDPGDLFPVSETCFVPGLEADIDLALTFVRNAKGKANNVLVDWNGRKILGTRVSPEPAK